MLEIRIRRLSLGYPGDVRPVGKGFSELRIRYGPGHRIYFISQGNMLIVLLTGGDKDSQVKDIQHAKDLARNLYREPLRVVAPSNNRHLDTGLGLPA